MEGDGVGMDVVGSFVGLGVGITVGLFEGRCVVGNLVGDGVGTVEGLGVGLCVGPKEGAGVGKKVVGFVVGEWTGVGVGSHVSHIIVNSVLFPVKTPSSYTSHREVPGWGWLFHGPTVSP
jgi:hypothetical protein